MVVSLRLLLDWPRQGGAVAGAATVLDPARPHRRVRRRSSTRVDHLLVTTVSVSGLTGIVVAVYLVVVIGLGRVPHGGERQVLLLSMAAAGVAALLYLPARERLTEAANRLVYGERHAPDEVLRTFGIRLSRAIPMDELLLQLAESLRKTMALTAAEVWTGTSGEPHGARGLCAAPSRRAARDRSRRLCRSCPEPACRAAPGSACGSPDLLDRPSRRPAPRGARPATPARCSA